jgi:uncharacterized protein
MPDTSIILATLTRLKPTLQAQFEVERLGLFGSHARNEARADSDIDIIVSLRRPTFAAFVGVQETLEEHLGENVDVICDGKHLRAKFRQTLAREAVYV